MDYYSIRFKVFITLLLFFAAVGVGTTIGWVSCDRQAEGGAVTNTPVTNTGLREYDYLPPIEAIRRAWTSNGWDARRHERMKQEVRETMPVLARALDRLAGEGGDGS